MSRSHLKRAVKPTKKAAENGAAAAASTKKSVINNAGKNSSQSGVDSTVASAAETTNNSTSESSVDSAANVVLHNGTGNIVDTATSAHNHAAAFTNTADTINTNPNTTASAANRSTTTETKTTNSKSFQGTATGFGTTIERPHDATEDTQWHCGNRGCTTGQTWKPRDGGENNTNGFGRKVISNFFGRNKKQTSSIHIEVWHNFCRKCYQRQTYEARKSPLEACRFYLNNLETQIDRIMLWRPEAEFKVQLSKGARDRLNNYFKELSKNQDKDAAKEAVKVVPKNKQKGNRVVEVAQTLEDAFDIEQMKYFDDTFCTESAVDITRVRGILQWVSERIEAGEITCMPPMEFLINAPTESETIKDPANNYDLWCNLDDDKRGVRKQSITDSNSSEIVQDSTEEAITTPGNSQSSIVVENASDTNPSNPPSSDGEETTPANPYPGSIKVGNLYLLAPYTRPLSSTYGAKEVRRNISSPGKRRNEAGEVCPAAKRARMEIPDPNIAIESIESVAAAAAVDDTQNAALQPTFAGAPAGNVPASGRPDRNWWEIFPCVGSRFASYGYREGHTRAPRFKRNHSEPCGYYT